MTHRDKSPNGFRSDEISKTLQQGSFGDYMSKLEAEEKLKKYEDKLSKGIENIRIHNEKKSQKVRE